MAKFRKKPIVIEAEQYAPHYHAAGRAVDPFPALPTGVRRATYTEVADALGTSGCSKEEPYWNWSVMGVIETLEGPHFVIPGDWIITGVKGEKYPCKPDIFEQTYELVQRE